jgi:hypothetical protein
MGPGGGGARRRPGGWRRRWRGSGISIAAAGRDTAGPLDVEYDAATRAAGLAADAGDEGLRALCLNLLAAGSFYTDFGEAWRLGEQAHVAARAGRDTFVAGGARALQAIILHLRGRPAEAEAIIDETVRQCLPRHRGVLSALLACQADGALAVGDPARALDLAAQALLVAEPLGGYLRAGTARSVLAQIKALTGDLAGAAEVIGPVLRLAEGAEDEVFVPGLDHAVAVLPMRRDDPQAAVTWLQRAVGSTGRGARPGSLAGRCPGPARRSPPSAGTTRRWRRPAGPLMSPGACRFLVPWRRRMPDRPNPPPPDQTGLPAPSNSAMQR